VFALVVLATLAVVAPWPFGSVDPRAVLVIALLAAASCAIALAWAALDGGLVLPDVPLLPLAALLALGLLQIVPLPAGVHAVLGPASHAVWSPASAEARAVLGEGAHPLSVHPAATWRTLLFASGLCGLAVVAAPALGRRANALRAAAVVVAGGTAVAVYGVFARARFGNLIYGQVPVPTVNPFGPFVSKNHFASYVGMAALLALGLAVGLASRASRSEWTTGRRSVGVVLAIVAALAMGLGVLVSLSRGGAAALAGGALAFVALSLRRRHGHAHPRALCPPSPSRSPWAPRSRCCCRKRDRSGSAR
jgi:hypothetical protein